MTDDTASNRWLRAIAAVVAVASVIAGPLLVLSTEHAPVEVGALAYPGTAGATDPTTPPTAITPPVTFAGDGSREGPLVPSGAPTSATPSELVASITLFHRGAYRLYADGRLLWYDETRLDSPVPRDRFGWAEQQLSAAGVERVRSAFLASGLFDASDHSDADRTCTDGFDVCVRDGDGWLVVDADLPPFPRRPFGNAPPEAVALFSFLGTLNSALPPTDWARQPVGTYVPSRLDMCLRSFVKRVEVPFELSVFSSRFSQPVAEALGGLSPTVQPANSAGTSVGQGSCFAVSLDQARTLADVFLSPIGGGTHAYWGIVISFGRRPHPARPGTTRREAAYVFFEDLLPEGAPSAYFGG